MILKYLLVKIKIPASWPVYVRVDQVEPVDMVLRDYTEAQ